jgi:hypothetical protein
MAGLMQSYVTSFVAHAAAGAMFYSTRPHWEVLGKGMM